MRGELVSREGALFCEVRRGVGMMGAKRGQDIARGGRGQAAAVVREVLACLDGQNAPLADQGVFTRRVSVHVFPSRQTRITEPGS